jgi:CPA2 family monovalent cation:H+ antiporter-2
MEHDTPLITTIAVGLGAAFILGAIANRLKVSPLVGYLLAGVMIGPATPGFVADPEIAPELAEIGVILLMFGVGLHFSIKDLLSVKWIAIPGAVGQIVIATLMGMGLAWTLGWPVPAGLVFGLALSVASTVVLLRALQERHLLDTTRGRIAVGWLIVEDLAMVLALVLLPALADIAKESAPNQNALLLAIGITVGKVVAFIAFMLIIGRRVIPWVLHWTAHSGSRELFRLAVLAVALGIAYGAAKLFGVSFALGAFFAGMILSESPLSQRAAQESLPLRDAFAVLFFVSVGMLFDPAILIERPISVLMTVLIIVLGKSVAAYLIVRAFRYSGGVALTISASLAQVGEFSFILAALGTGLGLLPQAGQDLILAGAIVSILLNPVLFDLLDRRRAAALAALAAVAPPVAIEPAAAGENIAPPMSETPAPDDEEGLVPTALIDHAIVICYGRVGNLVGQELKAMGMPVLVVETDPDRAAAARLDGIAVVVGNAADSDVLAALNLARAKFLFIAIAEAFEAGSVIADARKVNPDLPIIARAHYDAEVHHLKSQGATAVVMGEREIARSMVNTVTDATEQESVPPAAPEAGAGEGLT